MADRDLKDKWLKQRGGKMNLSLLLNSSSCLADRVDDSGAEQLLTPPEGEGSPWMLSTEAPCHCSCTRKAHLLDFFLKAKLQVTKQTNNTVMSQMKETPRIEANKSSDIRRIQFMTKAEVMQEKGDCNEDFKTWKNRRDYKETVKPQTQLFKRKELHKNAREGEASVLSCFSHV